MVGSWDIRRHRSQNQTIGMFRLKLWRDEEPFFSGDFGDFASFVTHMKELAIVSGTLDTLQ